MNEKSSEKLLVDFQYFHISLMTPTESVFLMKFNLQCYVSLNYVAKWFSYTYTYTHTYTYMHTYIYMHIHTHVCVYIYKYIYIGFPGGSDGKEWRRPGFTPWVGKDLWKRVWQPTPIFLPGECPWTEEPSRLQSMGLQRVRHNWLTELICNLCYL